MSKRFEKILKEFTDIPKGYGYIVINHEDKTITFDTIDLLLDMWDDNEYNLKNDLESIQGVERFNNGLIEFIDNNILTMDDIMNLEKLFYVSELYEHDTISFYSVRDCIAYIMENY